MFCTLVRHTHSLSIKPIRFIVTYHRRSSRLVMRFTFTVVLLGTSLAVVSALPRPIYSTGETEIALERRMDPPGPSRIQPSRAKKHDAVIQAAKVAQRPHNPWQVDLHQSQPTTPEEHWSLQFHPHQAGRGSLHSVEAVSSAGRDGVLETDHTNRGRWNPQPPNPNHPNPSIRTPIADFPNGRAALSAVHGAQSVHLTQPYPHENCVDWTCHAVNHMVAQGHIPAHAPGVQNFHGIYEAQREGVRHATDTPENRYAAQMGEHPPPGHVYPAPGQGYPAQGQGHPAQGHGYPAQGHGYPAQGHGYPAPGPGYPAPGPGYPGTDHGHPGAGHGYPGY